MVILGIDPGTATTGYGVVEFRAGQLKHCRHGSIRTPAKQGLPHRLKSIYTEVRDLIDETSPDTVAVEQLFFSRNTTSALAVGHARGVILLAAAERGLRVVEYTPMQVKQSISGYGGADKMQVTFMVRALLSLNQNPTPDDAADALAIAICHAHAVTAEGRMARAFEEQTGQGGV